MVRKFYRLSTLKKRYLIDAGMYIYVPYWRYEKKKNTLRPKQNTPTDSSGMESRIWMADKWLNTWEAVL